MTLEQQNILSDEYKSFMYFLHAMISMSKWSQSLNVWIHTLEGSGYWLQAKRDIQSCQVSTQSGLTACKTQAHFEESCTLWPLPACIKFWTKNVHFAWPLPVTLFSPFLNRWELSLGHRVFCSQPTVIWADSSFTECWYKSAIDVCMHTNGLAKHIKRQKKITAFYSFIRHVH